MTAESKIEIKTTTREEVEAEMGCKIPDELGDNDVIMSGGDEPYASELAAYMEKAGLKVKRVPGSSPGSTTNIICPLCGRKQTVPTDEWLFQSTQGHGHTCGSGKCPSHTYMVIDLSDKEGRGKAPEVHDGMQ